MAPGPCVMPSAPTQPKPKPDKKGFEQAGAHTATRVQFPLCIELSQTGAQAFFFWKSCREITQFACKKPTQPMGKDEDTNLHRPSTLVCRPSDEACGCHSHILCPSPMQMQAAPTQLFSGINEARLICAR